MTETLKRLAELTENLPELNDLETNIGGPAVLFEDAQGIPSFGLGVYKDRDMGVMRTYAAKGARIETHVHAGEHEWLGVLWGRIMVSFPDDNQEVVLNPFSILHIEPGRPHDVVALEDSSAWSLTVPPAHGYPDVQVCPFANKLNIFGKKIGA